MEVDLKWLDVLLEPEGVQRPKQIVTIDGFAFVTGKFVAGPAARQGPPQEWTL